MPARAPRLPLLALAAWASLSVAAAPTERPLEAILVVVNKTDGTVSLLDPGGGEPLAAIPVGHAPHEVVVSRDGRLAYVANYGDRETPGRTISVIDVPRRRVVSTIPLGEYRRPHGLALSRDGRRLFVTVEASQAVLEIDTASERVSRAFPTEQDVSHMCVLTPDEKKLYVANIGSRSVSVVHLERGSVSRVETGDGPEGIDVSPDGREVWVANRSGGDIAVLETRTDSVVARLPAGRFPIRVKFTPDGERVLVSDARGDEVLVFAARERAVQARIPTGRAPIGILVEPGGRSAWVAQTEADRVSRIDLARLAVASHATAGREPDGLGWAARAEDSQAGLPAGR